MKVVLNKCYSGFGLSPQGIFEYLRRKGKECHFYQNIDNGKAEKVSIDKLSYHEWVSTKDLGENPSREDVLHIDNYFYYGNIDRNDTDLVAMIEENSELYSDRYSHLVVVDIPDDVYESGMIEDYDGYESFHESHRIW
jgi:hypothetical protein